MFSQIHASCSQQPLTVLAIATYYNTLHGCSTPSPLPQKDDLMSNGASEEYLSPGATPTLTPQPSPTEVVEYDLHSPLIARKPGQFPSCMSMNSLCDICLKRTESETSMRDHGYGTPDKPKSPKGGAKDHGYNTPDQPKSPVKRCGVAPKPMRARMTNIDFE
jgi:hypothetical protein